MKLSVVMPVYNEESTLEAIVGRVLTAHDDLELVIVNDASRDGTAAVLEQIAARESKVRVFHHERNRGKGAALRTGFAQVTGDIVIIQDADLEYDPSEYPRLLEPILQDGADVVFGSRFLGGGPHRVCYFWHAVGNRFLTFLSNMMNNLNLTDMETCYKAFRREVLDRIKLRANRFTFEPEFTAKVARAGCVIYEVPVSYHGRTYAEGKKIGWKDGMTAIGAILRYRFFD